MYKELSQPKGQERQEEEEGWGRGGKRVKRMKGERGNGPHGTECGNNRKTIKSQL